MRDKPSFIDQNRTLSARHVRSLFIDLINKYTHRASFVAFLHSTLHRAIITSKRARFFSPKTEGMKYFTSPLDYVQ